MSNWTPQDREEHNGWTNVDTYLTADMVLNSHGLLTLAAEAATAEELLAAVREPLLNGPTNSDELIGYRQSVSPAEFDANVNKDELYEAVHELR